MLKVTKVNFDFPTPSSEVALLCCFLLVCTICQALFPLHIHNDKRRVSGMVTA